MKIDMVELLAGLIVGAAGGAYFKEHAGSSSNAQTNSITELDSLSDENEMLRRRYKEAERQIEDLLSENEKLRRTSKVSDDDKDDLEDDLADAKAKIKKLTAQNEDLMRKITEYKEICASYEAKLANK